MSNDNYCVIGGETYVPLVEKVKAEQERDSLLVALKSTLNMLDEFSYQRILRGEDKHRILKLIADIEGKG